MNSYRVTFQEPRRSGQPQATAAFLVKAGSPVEATQLARRRAASEVPGMHLKRVEKMGAA